MQGAALTLGALGPSGQAGAGDPAFVSQLCELGRVVPRICKAESTTPTFWTSHEALECPAVAVLGSQCSLGDRERMRLQIAAAPQWLEQLYVHLLHLLGLPPGSLSTKGSSAPRSLKTPPWRWGAVSPSLAQRRCSVTSRLLPWVCLPGPGVRERAGFRLGEVSACMTLVLHVHVGDACVCVCVYLGAMSTRVHERSGLRVSVYVHVPLCVPCGCDVRACPCPARPRTCFVTL